jgi:hypothetical protein
MHSLRSKSAIQRFRLAAFLFCTKVMLVPACAGFLVYSIAVHDQSLTLQALFATGFLVSAVILQWLLSQRTNCPLCITPVLATKNCSKSRHARKFLGSYRLRVALSIIFRNSFRCPYCNEPTMLKVRDRRAYRPYSRG